MHLTAKGYAVAGIAVLIGGVVIGFGVGKAWQRAVDAAWWLRSAWSYARYSIGEAASVTILAALVIVASIAAIWAFA